MMSEIKPFARRNNLQPYVGYFLLVFLGLMGLLSSIYMNLVGQLYLSEIVFLLILPFILVRRRIRLQPNLTRVLLFGLMWLAILMLTDLARGTAVSDFLRGWAGIFFLLVDIFVLYILIDGQEQRLIVFLFGYVFGDFLQLYVQPSPYFIAEPWKFGYGTPVNLLVLLIMILAINRHPGRARHWVLPLIFLGSISLYMNSRILAGIVLLTAGLVWIRFTPLVHKLVRKKPFGAWILLGIFISLFTLGILYSYQYVVVQGWLGEPARLKYANQYNAQFGLFGIILGGRSEVIGAIQAISDSPLIGYGSWARDPAYRLYVYQLGYGLSANAANLVNRTDVIPAHSHFLQAWVWAGLVGALFWLLLTYVIVRYLLTAFRWPNHLFALVMYLSVHAIWNIFFSPFGSEMRIRWAYTLATLFVVMLPVKDGFMPVFDRSRAAHKESAILEI